MIQDIRTPFHWRNVNVSSSQYECYIFTSFPSHHLLDHAGLNVFSAVTDFNLSQKSNFGNYIKTTGEPQLFATLNNNQQMGRAPLISCVVHRCGDQQSISDWWGLTQVITYIYVDTHHCVFMDIKLWNYNFSTFLKAEQNLLNPRKTLLQPRGLSCIQRIVNLSILTSRKSLFQLEILDGKYFDM